MTLASARPAKLGALAALAAMFAVGSLAGLSAFFLAPNVGQAAEAWTGNYFIQAFVRWDAGWYGEIARSGYRYAPGQQSPVAFFPLYPLIVGAVSRAGVNLWLAGILVSGTFGVVATALFAAWSEKVVGREGALRSTAVFVAYPFSFYLFGVMYADSVFLVLAIGAFLALEHERLGWATVLGALATAARPVAPALVLGLLARRLEQRRARGESLKITDAMLLFAGAGLVAYVAYLWHAFGDPLAFVHAQSARGWDQTPGWRTWLKLTWFKILFPRVAPLVAIRLVGHAVVTFVMLGLVWPTGKRWSWGYALYVAAVIGMPALSSKDFMGMGRYALAGFPAFVTLAQILAERPWRLRAWLVASALTWVALVLGFGATGYIS